MAYIQPQSVALLSAVTSSATSVWVPINNAGRVSVMVAGNKISSGNGVFYIDVSNDASSLGGTSYNRITSNVTNTNTQTDTRVSTVTISSNGTSMLFFPPGDTFNYMRCKVIVTTDGTYYATAYID